MKPKKVTVIGGGTGTFIVLSGLKKHEHDLAAVVSMMDSGGSTGRLRDQLSVLPPGDVRQCLVALSEAPELWRKLFLYRFENGDLKGHNFGNIFLSALEKVSDDYGEVIDTARYVLKTKGDVIPVTWENTHIAVEYESGTKLFSEGVIDEDNAERSRIVKEYLDPAVQAHPEAIERIQKSDVLILGPGDLYTSIIPVLVAGGIKETIVSSRTKIVYICNLMTKAGQTTNYTASDHVVDITHYLGRSPDLVVMNDGEIPHDIIEWYKKNDEQPVLNDLDSMEMSVETVYGDLIDRTVHEKSVSDTLTRSILRHNSDILAAMLNTYISNV